MNFTITTINKNNCTKEYTINNPKVYHYSNDICRSRAPACQGDLYVYELYEAIYSPTGSINIKCDFLNNQEIVTNYIIDKPRFIKHICYDFRNNYFYYN